MKREEIIALAQKSGFEPIAHDDWVCFTEEIERLVRSVIAAEREACAKVCDDLSAHYWAKDDAIESVNCEECATAIRARGQQ